MYTQVIWREPRKWISRLAVLFLILVYGYSIKTSRSASFEPSFNTTLGFEPADVSSGELSLLTYNVAGLPEVISAAESPRAKSTQEISKRINAYDIVNVQEDFYYHRELYNGGNMHRYRTREKQGIPFGDGLNTFSKYPVRETHRVAWVDCYGADCLAAKGFSHVRIEVAKDMFVDVYNVHANAADSEVAAAARRGNLAQLRAYIQKHSSEQAVVVMGDFNAHYVASWDNLSEFYTPLELQDAWVHLKRDGMVPEVVEDFVVPNKLTLTDSCESIDKIFFRNSLNIEFTPRSYKVEKQRFANSQGQALSDHCAVSLRLSWQKRELSGRP